MSGERVYRLLQISDCHLYEDITQQGYLNINPYTALSAVLEACLHSKPDHIIVTGDISHDYTPSSYQHLSHLLSAYFPGVAYSVLPGNHDEAQQMTQAYGELNCWSNGSIQLGKWVVHQWNSQTASVPGYIDGQTLDEFEHSYQLNEDCFHLVALHHPLFDMNSWMDDIGLTNKQQVLSVLAKKQQVRGAIFGHVHTPKSQQYAHLQLMSCPSTCWQWAQTKEFGLSEQQQPGARLLTLQPSGQLHSELVQLAPLQI